MLTMQNFIPVMRQFLWVGFAFVCWLATEATASAQGPVAQTGVAKTMVGWLLVLLAVGLGLLVVCRPTGRLGAAEEKKRKKGK